MKIAIVRGDGGVSIASVYPPTLAIFDAYVERIVKDWAGAKPGRIAVSWSRIADDAAPSDRTFRDAWRFEGGSVVVDLDLAKGIQLAAIRRERDRALDATDKEHARVSDVGSKSERAELAKRRQALRDAPATIEHAITKARSPEELKAVWPEAVPRSSEL